MGPIIFALSNPNANAECTVEEMYTWSGGKAVFAAGVQSKPVKPGETTYLPGQANKFYTYPAIGLAVYATQAKRIPICLPAPLSSHSPLQPQLDGVGLLSALAYASFLVPFKAPLIPFSRTAAGTRGPGHSS
jgi:hypothetical protein